MQHTPEKFRSSNSERSKAELRAAAVIACRACRVTARSLLRAALTRTRYQRRCLDHTRTIPIVIQKLITILRTSCAVPLGACSLRCVLAGTGRQEGLEGDWLNLPLAPDDMASDSHASQNACSCTATSGCPRAENSRLLLSHSTHYR